VRIFEPGVARYVPTKRDPIAAHFCDWRANPNASWNENFIQHCKMQEITNHGGSLCFALLARLLKQIFPGLTVAARQERRLRARLAALESTLDV
jgi:hypothetical protein